MCISRARHDLPLMALQDVVSGPPCSSKSKVIQSATPPLPSRSSKHKCQRHVVVQHNYHDHAEEGERSTSNHASLLEDAMSQGGYVVSVGANISFPLKLFDMLSRVEDDGVAHIVSWQPHGRCFVVHKPEEFKSLLPRYFKLSKIASFQRQLNLYGFIRLTKGLDKGGYYNEMFLRGKAWLVNKILRVKVKGTGVRGKSNPEQEPDFWHMKWVSTPLSSLTHVTTTTEATLETYNSVPEEISSSIISEDDGSSTSESSCFDMADLGIPENEFAFMSYNILAPPSQQILPVQVDTQSGGSIPEKSAGQTQNDHFVVVEWGKPFHYLDSYSSGYPTQPSKEFDDSQGLEGLPDLDQLADDLFSEMDLLDVLGQPIM